MIKIIKGNLLDATEDVIAHQVNIEGVMGGGLARDVRIKFPAVFDAYAKFCKEQENKGQLLGAIQSVPINERQCICNLFAQSLIPIDATRRCTSYGALRACLKKINELYPGKSVAIPYRIGSALGGGDWGIIMDIILEECINIDITMYKLDIPKWK